MRLSNFTSSMTSFEGKTISESSGIGSQLSLERVGKQAETRNTRPVFVVGCPRSGTTLLYHMILSSGDFAGFPFESDIFRLLSPKFQRLSSLKNRQRLLECWLRSDSCAQSGLNREDLESSAVARCRNIGDFLRIVMEAICRKRGARRWAEKTPDNLLYISDIKRSIPDSLIVHIIRDGRDTALSLANFKWVRPFVWEQGGNLLSFGVYWKWLVRKGRAAGQRVGRDYYELHYEELVEKPRETLARLADFIGHELDYDRILRAGVGSVSSPYTSFQNSSETFTPVGRWKTLYPPAELAKFEALVGDCLEETGYSLATSPQQRRCPISTTATAALHLSELELKHQLKSHTPLGRLTGWRH